MKSLLLSLAFLAAGIAGSRGQVIAINIVGYINLNVHPGLNLIVNQLASTNDDLNSFMPQVPDGSVVFRFEPASQSYRDGLTFIAGVGWYPASGNPKDPIKSIPLGEAFFLQIPGTQPTVITFVGEVLLRSTNPIPGNYSLKGSIIPQAGPLVGLLLFNPVEGDLLYHWDPALQSFTAPAAFSEKTGWLPNEPDVAVGEGFLLFRNPALATPDKWWTRFFSIGPALSPASLAVAKEPSAPVIQHLVFPKGEVKLDVGNPSGQPYDVQFSRDGLVWKTLAAHQTAAQWKAPFTPGVRGYFRLNKPAN